MFEVHVVKLKTRDHLLVRASAGSGKTYQLIRRLISLLADGVDPSSILAITFSRKSAGEFRRKLFETLGKAASDKSAAAVLAAEIGHEDWGSDAFRALLKKQVREPQKIRLSTIDAFFFEVIGMYRLELGIGSELALQDENLTESIRLDILKKMVQSLPDEQRETLLYLVQQTSWGSTANQFKSEFEKWLQDTVVLYRQAPQDSTWGKVPDSVSIKIPTPELWQKEVALFADALQLSQVEDNTRAALEIVIEQLYQWSFEPVITEPALKWIKAGVEDREKLLDGKKRFIPKGKHFIVNKDAGKHLIQLSNWFYTHKLSLGIKNTRIAYQFSRSYQQFYDKNLLERGIIQFEDFPYLLEQMENLEGGTLAYRLDSQIKHWLLDEFQDTSRAQWQVIEPLIDELFYDRDGDRSFYCVGDRKQAIYAWREGDSRLFDLLWDKYSPFEPRPLRNLDLCKTYRCPTQIVGLVNALLSNKEHFPETISPGAIDLWARDWIVHESAIQDDNPGHVIIREAAAGEEKDDLLIENLKSEKPWEDGSCAVLCRTNKEATRLSFLLREAGIPVARDGALHLTKDFLLGQAMRSLMTWIAYPGDRISHYWLHNSPALRWASQALDLRGFQHLKIINRQISLCPDSLRSRWNQLGEKEVLARIGTAMKADGYWSYSEEKCQQVLAHFFEKLKKMKRYGLPEILKQAENYRMESPADQQCVQVLTIHRAKGLEYDTVLLPELNSFDKSTGAVNSSMWKIENDKHQIESILESPEKMVCQLYPELNEWNTRLTEEIDYEKICLFYVGLTRASRSLWLYLDKAKKKAPVKEWIQSALGLEAVEDPTTDGIIYESGHRHRPSTDKTTPNIDRQDSPEPFFHNSLPATNNPFLSVKKRRPSEAATNSQRPGGWKKKQISLEFGRKVHRCLATMEWPAKDWASSDCRDPQIESYLSEALANPSIRDLLNTPTQPTLVWREKAFDVCLDKEWVSGIFDRVQIPANWKNDSSSKIQIIDFKTNQRETPHSKETSDADKAYKQQLDTYRDCLSRILNLPTDRIECILIYLGSGETMSW